MNTLLELLDKGSAQILAPLQRFPLATFLAFIFILMTSIKMSFQFDHSLVNPYDGTIEKIAFISLFGFFFLLGLRLMARNFLVPFIGLLILVGFYFYLPASLNDYISNEQGKITYPLILAGLFSFIIVAPFITHRSSNRAFFEWFKHFVYSVFLTAIVSIILFATLNISIEILSGLFEMGARYRYVKFFSFFSFAFFAPYLFLSILIKEPREVVMKSYNKAEEVFFKYILTALFIIYFLIIYSYLGKMIVLFEYPKGMVSINIIAFSALAIMTYLFWTPLWNEKNSKYKKVIWIAIILQVILLWVALYLRVDAYGWTFGRLILASLGLWLFALSFYALIKNEISFRGLFFAVPLIIIVNLLFSSSISKSSQQSKLSSLLGSVDSFSDESNISLRYNISSTLEYLHNHHGTDALFPIIPTIVSEYEHQNVENMDNCAIPVNKNFPSFVTDKLGFKYINEWDWKQKIRKDKNFERYPMRMKRFHSVGNPLREGLSLSGYDWIGGFNYYKSNVFLPSSVCEPKNNSNEEQRYLIKTEGNEISMEEEKEILLSINIEEFLKEVIKLDDKNENRHEYFNDGFTQKEFTYLYENDKIKVKLLFKSIEFTLKDELNAYDGLILIGKKDGVNIN